MLSKNKYKPAYDPEYLGCKQKFIARLNPNFNDRNKSYYGKARVIEWEDGSKALISYNTIVASITPDNEFHKMWGHYSVTTMKHINTFCDDYEQPTFNKSEWKNIDVWFGSESRQFRLSHDMQFERIQYRADEWGWC